MGFEHMLNAVQLRVAVLIVSRDPAGTATRPLRVQRRTRTRSLIPPTKPQTTPHHADTNPPQVSGHSTSGATDMLPQAASPVALVQMGTSSTRLIMRLGSS